MALHLTFDTTDTGRAGHQHTGKVLTLMDVDQSLPGTDPQTNNARPPYVVFHWGNLHSFKAVVTDLNLRFTYFSSTGVPLRAEVDLLLHAVRRVRRRSARRTRRPERRTRIGCTGSSPARRSTASRPSTTAIPPAGGPSRRPTASSIRWPCGPAHCCRSRGPTSMTTVRCNQTIAPVIKVNGATIWPSLALMQLDDLRISRGAATARPRPTCASPTSATPSRPARSSPSARRSRSAPGRAP